MWDDVRGLWAGLSSTGVPWALSLLLVPLILSSLPNRWDQQVSKAKGVPRLVGAARAGHLASAYRV